MVIVTGKNIYKILFFIIYFPHLPWTHMSLYSLNSSYPDKILPVHISSLHVAHISDWVTLFITVMLSLHICCSVSQRKSIVFTMLWSAPRPVSFHLGRHWYLLPHCWCQAATEWETHSVILHKTHRWNEWRNDAAMGRQTEENEPESLVMCWPTHVPCATGWMLSSYLPRPSFQVCCWLCPAWGSVKTHVGILLCFVPQHYVR